MRIYGLWLLLFGNIVISQNCNYTFSGKVTDLHDGSPLVEARVAIAHTEKIVLTDENGNFIIPNLCNQTYTISVSHPLCTTKQYRIKIRGNTTKVFRLEHHIQELNEVIVKGKSYKKKTHSLLENRVLKKDLERFSSASIGDVLNNLSGVSSLNTGNTIVKPIINGLHSSRIITINNGVRMEDQEWGAEHAPNIDINSSGGITLIKGAGALQYGGDAIGGVIVSEISKTPLKDSLYGKTLFAGISNGRGGSLTAQLTKSYKNGWHGIFQGTYKRLGDTRAPDYTLSNTGVQGKNASLSIGFNGLNYGIEGYYSLFKNDIGILRASHIGGAEDQVLAINQQQPLIINDFTYNIAAPGQDVTHHLVKLSGFKKMNSRGKLSFQYDFQFNNRLEFDIRRGDDRNNASLDLELKTHTLKFDVDANISETSNLKTGILMRYQNNFANPDTGVRRLIPDYYKYHIGVYGILDHRFNEKWLAELGSRFDYNHMDVFKFYRTSFWESRNYDDLFSHIVVQELNNQILTNPKLNFYNFSATAGIKYSFKKYYDVYMNYSLASRSPNPSELFSEGLHHSASRIELGDLRFRSETAHKISLTFLYNNENVSVSINPYVNIIHNFIVIEPTGVQQTIRGNFQIWEYRQTDALLAGLDIDVSYKLAGNLRLYHRFSLVKGYDRTRDLPLIQMPPVRINSEMVYKNEKANNVRIALQSVYVFRQNEFPDNNFDVFIPGTGSFETVDVSTPPGAYHILNVNSSVDFNISKNSWITIGANINNILNTNYRDYLNRLRYYADDLGRNFLLSFKINY
ncbi:MAG: TonB-dependent receptor [Flavobacteriaceae bacterium]|nr:MAG: TonB-dependent receptor [Flavobacteriaceae bacterium]